MELAHRVVYLLLIGDLPPFLKETCVKGHPLAGDNLVSRLDYKGRARRECRTCKNETNRAYRARSCAEEAQL